MEKICAGCGMTAQNDLQVKEKFGFRDMSGRISDMPHSFCKLCRKKS